MDTTEITHVSLCAGYGGIDLGLRRVLPNLRTIAYSEVETFAVENLLARMEGGQLDPAPVWSDLRTFPWSQFSGLVDILSGGFPCQPFSSAGKRAGDEDARHLFPHILEGIRQCRPAVVFLENVEGIISSKIAGDHWNDPAGTPVLLHVLRELERVGYKATAGVFSASECGAVHQRKRVFILAMADSLPERLQRCLREQSDARWLQQQAGRGSDCVWPSRPGKPQHAWEPPRVVTKLAESKSVGYCGLTPKCEPIFEGGVSKVDQSNKKCASESIGCGTVNQPPRVVGNARGDGWREDQQGRETEERAATDWASEGVGNAECVRQSTTNGNNAGMGDQECQEESRESQSGDTSQTADCAGERQTQPALGGDIDGTASRLDYAQLCVSCDSRVDELRLLGNGVVPGCAAIAMKTLIQAFMP